MLRGSFKEPSTPKASGLAHLMTALHQNAAAVVNSKTQLNGPDQILPADGFTTSRRNGSVKLRREDVGLGSEEPISVPTLLRETADAYPEVVALRVKRDGVCKTWTYEHYFAEVQLAARGFIHLGLQRHHAVAILGPNSPEWVIADLGAIFAGAIAVGQSNILSADEIAKEALDAKADIIVVENEDLLKRVLLIQHKLPELKAIVQIKGDPPVSDKRRLNRTHKKHIVSWSQLLEIGRELPEGMLDDRLIRLGINQCCSLVYTSDSNGPTKGVMLTHDNLTWCSKMVLGLVRPPGFNRLPAPGEEVILSYIPFTHIASQTIDIYYSITIAGTLCFVDDGRDLMENTEALFDAIAVVQPTVFFGPPRAYEMLYHRLRETKRRMSGAHRLIVDWSNRALRDKHLAPAEPQSARRSNTPKKLGQLRDAVAKKAVCQKYKEMLGFTSRTVFLCRGSPLAREVFKYLAGFDIVVHEMLGQSENCGLLTANIPKRYLKLGTTGKSVPGVKAKVTPSSDAHVKTPRLESGASSDNVGEICGWGRNIFMGYLNKENDTNEVFNDEHWLRLGDLGLMDDDGFLIVLGKLDEFITLSSGEVISPLRIEQLVRLELPCVRHVMVVGEGQDHLPALLTLHTDVDENTKLPGNVLTEDVRRWFRQSRYDVRTVPEVLSALENGLKHVIQAGIDRANQSAHCTAHMLVNWRIMPGQFTYQNGELGVTGQLKRRAIIEKYSSCVTAMFSSKLDGDDLDCSSLNGDHKPITALASFLSQIKEEDESKTSSRNSIDKDYLERMAAFNAAEKAEKELEKTDEGITVVVKAEVKEEPASDVISAEPSVHRQVIQIVSDSVNDVKEEGKEDDKSLDSFELDSLEVATSSTAAGTTVTAVNATTTADVVDLSKTQSHRKISDSLISPEDSFLERSRVSRR